MIRLLRQDLLLGLVGVAIGTDVLRHVSPLPVAAHLMRALAIL